MRLSFPQRGSSLPPATLKFRILGHCVILSPNTILSSYHLLLWSMCVRAFKRKIVFSNINHPISANPDIPNPNFLKYKDQTKLLRYENPDIGSNGLKLLKYSGPLLMGSLWNRPYLIPLTK
jgi:hypothetical protein